MTNESYNVLGVMSGTSLDGIDLAQICLTHSGNKWHYSIGYAQTVPYSAVWVHQLKNAIDYTEAQLDVLNRDYTVLLGGIINNFLNQYNIIVDAVCSHGHTILHKPNLGYTLQIGNLPQIAKLIGKKVVCDFRVQDVQLGGQGAPLVPIGDRLLFSNYDYCLNLGGFSNISFEEGEKRIAYDISPVNTVLNYYANILGYDYDDGGQVAAGGKCHQNLLDKLNALEFYSAPYPKSLGFEFVKETILPLIEKHNISVQDKICTFTHHIAQQVSNNIKGKNKSLLITGGGAYNTFLIDTLKSVSPDTIITIPDDKTIQYKEALIFALLGVLKLQGDINVLASVTGAAYNHCSGFVYEP